ncbi:MAG: hypothetical protein FWG30_10730 [Eubacteriaceae bacterium]|nr:hypothetical protein [Eubacteriaceae bacterium]
MSVLNNKTSAFLSEMTHPTINVISNTTSSSYNNAMQYCTLLPSNLNVFANVADGIGKLEDHGVAMQVQKVLSNLYTALQAASSNQIIDNHLSLLHLAQQDDRSALVEWNFQDFRIGFSIELDKDESSYYVVTQDRDLKAFEMGTYKLESNNSSTFEKIVEFVLGNT